MKEPCGSFYLVRDERQDKMRRGSLPCIKLHLPSSFGIYWMKSMHRLAGSYMSCFFSGKIKKMCVFIYFFVKYRVFCCSLLVHML